MTGNLVKKNTGVTAKTRNILPKLNWPQAPSWSKERESFSVYKVLSSAAELVSISKQLPFSFCSLSVLAAVYYLSDFEGGITCRVFCYFRSIHVKISIASLTIFHIFVNS